MTELQLYEFIQDNNIDYNIEESETGIEEIYAFIPLYALEDFNILLKDSLLLIDNPLECYLKEHHLCVKMMSALDYFNIEPENIFKQK